MRNLKIGQRVAAGFDAVIAISVALGIFADTRIRVIDANSTNIAGHRLPHEVIELDSGAVDPPPIAMRWRTKFMQGMGRAAKISSSFSTTRSSLRRNLRSGATNKKSGVSTQ